MLHHHAETSLPFEAVALLFGIVKGFSVMANRIEIVRNKAPTSTTSFEVNPEEQYRLLIAAEELGDEIIGIFHSHPAPPYPSLRDQKNMKLNPVVWLIASKESGTWVSKAFLLEDEQVIEVDLQLV